MELNLQEEKKKPLVTTVKAKINYYEKVKNRRLTDPEFVEKQKIASLKNYYKIKDDPEYKEKVSKYKKQLWIKKKENNLLLL